MSHTTTDRRRVLLNAQGSVIRNFEAESSGGWDLTPSAALGGWEGALQSPDRGWVYVPSLKTTSEVDTYSRTELYNKIAHLTRNQGLPRRILKCITRMVIGNGLMPEPMTKDQRYNDNVRRLWTERAESPKSFSLSEKFSCSSAQRILKYTQLRIGDAAMVAARDEENRLRFALYGGNQIGDGSSRPENMRDGVLIGEHDQALAYRFVGRKINGEEKQVDVPASNVLFLATREGIEWHRGVTVLAHGVNKLKDRDDIRKALNKGIKMSSYQAWAIETQLGSASGPGNLGPGGGPRPTVIVEDPKTKKPMALEKMLEAGQIEELKPGQSLKILHDQRPHPNVQAFEEEQIRDIVNGTDWPFELLWKIQALGGANTRFILVDAQSKAEEEQEGMVEILAPMYLMLLQDWEAQGDLPPCEDPEWYLHEWVTPPRLSVDFERSGRIYIDQWVRGHITLKTIFGSQGYRWKRETTQWLEEIAWKKAEMKRLNLTRADLPAAPGAQILNDPEAKPAKGKPESDPDDEEDDI
jgi:capsid protein